MKALAFSLIFAPLAAFASPQPIPGSQVEHRLSCQYIEPVGGVGYGLKVFTQALAPQYNVRGISLLSQVVYPGAPVHETKLVQLSQDASSASFASSDQVVRVDLVKADFSAKVFFNGKHMLNCKY